MFLEAVCGVLRTVVRAHGETTGYDGHMTGISALNMSALLLLAFTAHAQTYDLHLDNGVIRVGVETDEYGGAITYISEAGSGRNLINNYDRGRQVQQSYYAGRPLDRTDEGQSPDWSPWAWNPIQVGDTYGNSSEVLEAKKKDGELYVKTRPLLWDMNNEFGECHFESWITLDDNTVHVRNKLTSYRTDDNWPAVENNQECPAVYTVGDLHRLVTYEGDAPFAHGPLKTIENDGPPWAHWGSAGTTEHWAAMVNDEDWGLGVYNAEATRWSGGFHGTAGGGEFDDSTGYISPLQQAKLDRKTVLEYEYHLILGTLDEIRAWVYAREGK